MSRREEAVNFIRMGNPPSRVAQIMGVSRETVMAYLYQKIGERQISRYELILSISREDREKIDHYWDRFVVQKVYKDFTEFFRDLVKNCGTMDPGDAFEYLLLRNAALADMYELIRDIETHLHAFVKRVLAGEHGMENWWRVGVPLRIRKELQCLREEDPEPAPEPYNYTTLIHLKEIFDSEWPSLCRDLPDKVRGDKKAFLSNLTRLNRIRNVVMHPVKGIRVRDDDFIFVQSLKESLHIGLKRKGS